MTSYQRIGANIEARKHKDGETEYLYLRMKISENGEDYNIGESSTGKSQLIGSTRGNQDLGMVSDDLIDVVAGVNVYRPKN